MPELETSALKPLFFMGSSKEDLSGFPDPVKQDIGHALFVAQEGGRAPSVKTLQGFGGGSVVEIVEDHDGDGGVLGGSSRPSFAWHLRVEVVLKP